jgi:hypothetical protein
MNGMSVEMLQQQADFMPLPPAPQEVEQELDVLAGGYDVVAEAEAYLVQPPQDAYTDPYANFDLTSEDFGVSEFSEEARELAYNQAMAFQNLDILGMLEHDEDDAASVAQSERVMDAFNSVNLASETLSVDGLLAAVTLRNRIFETERASDFLRMMNQEDEEDED